MTKIIEKIREFIYNIVEDALNNRRIKTDLDTTSDICRLIIDIENRKISFKTLDFLSRMNIDAFKELPKLVKNFKR